MNEILIVYCSILTGFALAAMASLFGAWLSCKIMAGKGGTLPFVPEPKGEVFTIEDTDDPPFPEEKGSEAQEHILERTNKFLQTLGGK
jgi:hypothetical protein